MAVAANIFFGMFIISEKKRTLKNGKHYLVLQCIVKYNESWHLECLKEKNTSGRNGHNEKNLSNTFLQEESH